MESRDGLASVVEWSITPDCKSGAFGLRRFKSCPAHNEKIPEFYALGVFSYVSVREDLNQKGVGETRCFPVEEGNELASVGKPWVSKVVKFLPGALYSLNWEKSTICFFWFSSGCGVKKTIRSFLWSINNVTNSSQQN